MAGEAPKSEKKRRFDHSSDLGGLEASVEDLISSVCDSESKEGAWMSDYDIVKRGTALKLESQVGGDTVGGHCRRECRTECRKLAPDGHHHLLAPAPKAPAVAVCGAEGARRRRSPKALAVAALQRHQSGPSAPSLATQPSPCTQVPDHREGVCGRGRWHRRAGRVPTDGGARGQVGGHRGAAGVHQDGRCV